MPTLPDFDPIGSDSPLICYLDIKSPFAFVAKDPTYAMADRLGIEVDWRPLTLDIPSFLGSARLDANDRVVESNRSETQWKGVKYAYRDARRYAALLGYTLRGTVKIWDTSLVHMAFMWAKRQGYDVLRGYLDRCYERFWRRELDAEDIDVVLGVLREAGAETTGFREFVEEEGRREHDAMQSAIFDAGIFGVPSYVVEGELYFGREHLPTVEWLLRGRPGPHPDVAYRRFEPLEAP